MTTQPWIWFLSADDGGRWIIAEGEATVVLEGGNFQATLRYFDSDPDEPPYHELNGNLDADGALLVEVTSPTSGSMFELRGQLFSGYAPPSSIATTIILTDGTTVLGLATGPKSHKRYSNYPAGLSHG